MPPLSDIDRKRLVQAAEERGLDPDEVIRAAERHDAERNALRDNTDKRDDDDDQDDADGAGKRDDGRPIAERMLIGFLPFVTVREFRSLWLGLDERVPDDELMTGEWLLIHGSTGPTSASGGSPE